MPIKLNLSPEEKKNHRREIRRAQNRRYYNQNRDKVINHCLEKIECPCCKLPVIRTYLKRHRRTKKCVEIGKMLETQE